MFNARRFQQRKNFKDYLQQFTTAARLSGWQTATTDNRQYFLALGLKGEVLIFYTTLTVTGKQYFDQLVSVFRATLTTNVEVLKAKLKTARQEVNQIIAEFPCDVRTLARRVYRGQPLIEEQIVLTSSIEGPHDAQIRGELRKSKSTTPNAPLVLAVELNAFMEMDLSLKCGTQTTVNMFSTVSPESLMATASNSQKLMMGTLIQTIRKEI